MRVPKGFVGSCGRPQRNLTSQPWPPGQLSLRWEAGKAPEKLVPNSINSKKRNRNEMQTVLERGQEMHKRLESQNTRAHTPGVKLNSPHPQFTLEKLERSELAAPET